MKKMINADLIGTFMSMIAISLVVFLSRKYNFGMGGRKNIKGNPLPNDNVIQAIRDMWDDRKFLDEFAKILTDEGDLTQLASKIRDVEVDNKWDLQDTAFMWRLINKVNFKPAPVAKKIVARLLITNSYKSYVKKYKFTKEDETYFAKLLLLTIMKSEFTQDAQKIIFNKLKDFWGNSKLVGADLTATTRS